jgi:hypothetical protein
VGSETYFAAINIITSRLPFSQSKTSNHAPPPPANYQKRQPFSNTPPPPIIDSDGEEDERQNAGGLLNLFRVAFHHPLHEEPGEAAALMEKKLKALIQKVKREHDDDAVDRVIYATTVYILGFFAILIMAKQYVGEPLQCWVPAEYTGAWEKYIENYCFVENTVSALWFNPITPFQYFVNKTIPAEHKERKEHELRYYQWIPYLLSIQALLCYAPKLIFKLLYSFSGKGVDGDA